jgi:Xaa-Pro aminopeptidase
MTRLLSLSRFAVLFLLALPLGSLAPALERQPLAVYHARRVALGERLAGGLGILFAAPEPVLDFDPYRQDSDFYYLTGWNQPGAALLIVSPAPRARVPRAYREILFLPERDLRVEKYTGAKLAADTPGAGAAAGFDEVLPMAQMPTVLGRLTAEDRRLGESIWTQPLAPPAHALLDWSAAVFGKDASQLPATHDVARLTMPLRIVKDDGEIALLRKAADASVAAQRAMMQSVRPGVTERALAGRILAALMENGCERPSYAPIVGSGPNSVVLHYSENSRTLATGDLVVVDAAGEYSMYASDITRTVPASGRFTARQKEIYDVVLGAQQAAAAAFAAGRSKLLDSTHTDPEALDTLAYNYINTHGKGPHGEPLGRYWVHGLGHMVGIDVHDPADYPAVLRPGMVFTIEPGVYIPEENLGVRIEDTFLVDKDGRLVDLTAALPHTTEEVEAAVPGR